MQARSHSIVRDRTSEEREEKHTKSSKTKQMNTVALIVDVRHDVDVHSPASYGCGANWKQLLHIFCFAFDLSSPNYEVWVFFSFPAQLSLSLLSISIYISLCLCAVICRRGDCNG